MKRKIVLSIQYLYGAKKKKKSMSKIEFLLYLLKQEFISFNFQIPQQKSISDYNCSSIKARDFKLLKHKSKRFSMLKHKCRRLPMLKHKIKRLLFKQNYIENCLRVEHLIYNQWCSQIQISGTILAEV